MLMSVWENPWEGQGTVINGNGGYSSPEDAPGGFWDWWRKNGDTAVDAASDLHCLVFPNAKRCKTPAGPSAPGYYPTSQNNTILYVLIGVILILILILMFKK